MTDTIISNSLGMSPFYVGALHQKLHLIEKEITKWFSRAKREYFLKKEYETSGDVAKLEEYLKTRVIKLESLPEPINFWEAWILCRYLFMKMKGVTDSQYASDKDFFNVPSSLEENQLLDLLDFFYSRVDEFQTELGRLELKGEFGDYIQVNDNELTDSPIHDFPCERLRFESRTDPDTLSSLGLIENTRKTIVYELGKDLIVINRYTAKLEPVLIVDYYRDYGSFNQRYTYPLQSSEFVVFARVENDIDLGKKVYITVFNCDYNAYKLIKLDIFSGQWSVVNPSSIDSNTAMFLKGYSLERCYGSRHNYIVLFLIKHFGEDKGSPYVAISSSERGEQLYFTSIKIPDDFEFLKPYDRASLIQVACLSKKVVFFNPLNKKLFIVDIKDHSYVTKDLSEELPYPRSLLLPDSESSFHIISEKVGDWYFATHMYTIYQGTYVESDESKTRFISIFSNPVLPQPPDFPTDEDASKTLIHLWNQVDIPGLLPEEEEFFIKLFPNVADLIPCLDVFSMPLSVYLDLFQSGSSYQESFTPETLPPFIIPEEDNIYTEKPYTYIPKWKVYPELLAWQRLETSLYPYVLKQVKLSGNSVEVFHVKQDQARQVIQKLSKFDANTSLVFASRPVEQIAVLSSVNRTSWYLYNTTSDLYIGEIHKETTILEPLIKHRPDTGVETWVSIEDKKCHDYHSTFFCEYNNPNCDEVTVLDENFNISTSISGLESFLSESFPVNISLINQTQNFTGIIREVLYYVGLFLGEEVDIGILFDSELVALYIKLLEFFITIYSRPTGFQVQVVIDQPACNKIPMEDAFVVQPLHKEYSRIPIYDSVTISTSL